MAHLNLRRENHILFPVEDKAAVKTLLHKSSVGRCLTRN